MPRPPPPICDRKRRSSHEGGTNKYLLIFNYINRLNSIKPLIPYPGAGRRDHPPRADPDPRALLKPSCPDVKIRALSAHLAPLAPHSLVPQRSKNHSTKSRQRRSQDRPLNEPGPPKRHSTPEIETGTPPPAAFSEQLSGPSAAHRQTLPTPSGPQNREWRAQ